ncbi:SLAIN motif-containing protein 1a isoform X2 [Gadus morhua]|uniref:SLAIN motif-containing protein 1a isoform X2 n=1 Tax=Gadus morhua TaxID=8049 RepID=UPI0011B4F852|nr:SLAIN motif-containing protein 1 isoform X2 [Gadus morhua]
MEAEVLNPQMMADVNGNSKIANAELEVIKLQELVRKLEKQNEQLRTRANAVNNCTISGPHLNTSLSCLHGTTTCSSDHFSVDYSVLSSTQSHPSGLDTNTTFRLAEEPFAYFQPSSVSRDAAAEEGDAEAGPTVLDEVEMLDLNAVLPAGDADTWLYVSPRGRFQGEAVLSPLQWCRQVLDHPGPEVELAKMTLCHRLDQAKRWRTAPSVRPYSCIEGLSSLSLPILPYPKPAALTEPPAPLALSSHPVSLLGLPGRPLSTLSDRTPTFLSNTALHSVARRHAAVSPQSSMDSEVGASELEEDSISMGYKLQDMTDVQVMARLQEESLRQDYASTSATVSRRSSSFSINSLRRSEMDLEEEDEDEDEGYDQLPPPQPRLFRTSSMQRGGLPHSHTFSSIRDCRRSPSSPQFPLGGLSQYSGAPSLAVDTSMGYRSIAAVPSPGQLIQRVQSVGNFANMTRQPLKATAYVSPTVQQGPPPSTTPNTPSMTSSVSLHSFPSGGALPIQHLKPSSTNPVALPLKAATHQASAVPRTSLPRPASFVGTSGIFRPSKIAQPTRSLLAPPKSMAALSALRDGSWKDGCY